MKGGFMRALNLSAAVAIFFLHPCFGFVPSSIEKTNYNNQFWEKEATSRTYFDGLGREIRTVVEEGDGDVVSAIEYDEAGRPIQSLKPFYTTAHGHGWSPVNMSDLRTAAGEYYSGANLDRPNAGGYPFSETVYLSDPLRKSKEVSAPGAAFRIGGGRTVKKWYIGAATPEFVRWPTEYFLNSLFSSMGAKYVLEVTKDADSRFTQVLKDNLGRVLKMVSDPNPAVAGDEIVTENVYDASGHLVRTLLPGSGGAADPSMVVNYTYRSDGKLIEETFPDEGTSQYLYDPAGRLRLKSDARNAAQTGYYTTMTYYKYDMHGRKTEEGWVEFPSAYRSYYFNAERLSDPDFPPDGHLAKQGVRRWYYDDYLKLDPLLNVPAEVDLSEDPNSRGKVVASIAYNINLGSSAPVMKFFRYDKEGRVLHKTIVIPEIPTQFFTYQYDLQGRLLTKEHKREAPNAPLYTFTDYIYDSKGRMIVAMISGGQAINYSYDPVGKLKKKEMGNGLVVEERNYTIRDWLKTTRVHNPGNGSEFYREGLTYETAEWPAIPQYSGNVSIDYHFYPTSNLGTIGHSYTYDGANRLTRMASTLPSFKEEFAYDARGRIVTKAENGVTHGPYVYEPYSNRVSYIQGHPTRSNTDGNFFYDARGNMIYDRSKKMAVFYDPFNLPVLFRFYNTDPTPGAYLTHNDIQSEMKILYDADGQRVLKKIIPN